MYLAQPEEPNQMGIVGTQKEDWVLGRPAGQGREQVGVEQQ